MNYSDKESVLIISFQSLTEDSAGGTGFYGYKLSELFSKEKKLANFIVSSKGKFETTFPSKAVSFFSRYYLFILNKIFRFLPKYIYIKRAIEEELFDIFCQFKITDNIKVLVTTNPYLPRTLKRAQSKGIKTIFIPGNPEDNLIRDIVTQENNKYAVTGYDAYTFPFRLKIYNKSIPYFNRIIAVSSVTDESYKSRISASDIISSKGFIKRKTRDINNQLNRNYREKFVVGYLSYTVLLKGLQYLLKAWRDAELKDSILLVAGPIDEHVQKIINSEFADLINVEFAGLVTNKIEFYSKCDLFVQPSLIDGAPATVFEAMSYGVPVLLTDMCGAKDFITDNFSGLTVPANNSESLKEKVIWASNHRTELVKLGKAGKEAYDNFDLNHFIAELKTKIEA